MKSSASHGHTHSAVPLRLLGIIAASLLLPILTGCPGALGPGTYPERPGTGTGGTGGIGGGGTGGTTPPACDAPAMVLQKEGPAGGCLGSLCHTSVFPPILSAPAAGLKAALISGKASSLSGACAGQSFINPADPSASVILKRVQGTDCGERMPSKAFDPSLNYLSDSDIACIAGWVANP